MVKPSTHDDRRDTAALKTLLLLLLQNSEDILYRLLALIGDQKKGKERETWPCRPKLHLSHLMHNPSSFNSIPGNLDDLELYTINYGTVF